MYQIIQIISFIDIMQVKQIILLLQLLSCVTQTQSVQLFAGGCWRIFGLGDIFYEESRVVVGRRVGKGEDAIH